MEEYVKGLLHGRRVITTDIFDITPQNVVAILRKALPTHWRNKHDIEYLYAVYKNRQAILGRKKTVRPEICNKIVENRAAEIVDFKVGYFVGEPIQYVARGKSDEVSESLEQINSFMLVQDKDSEDFELAEWFHIAGTGYRMILPSQSPDNEAPFEIYTLDPRYTFVVYHSGLGNKPVLAVNYVTKEDGTVVYSCYTRDTYYEITNDKTLKIEPHVLGGIPIVEYPLNTARIGAFEVVLPLLDAINTVDSNRVDGVEQFIQALMLFHNVDISSDDYDQLREKGAIKYRDIDPNFKAEVKYLINELKQSETQVLVDHMYQVVLTIVGMPNRNGGSSTSDTGAAVTMRDGWSAAESRAKKTERMFRKPEKAFLKIVLNICDTLADVHLKLSDIDIRFTRRNYENIQEKSQVLITMLGSGKVHPRLAFEHSGLFADPERAYAMSMEYAAEQEEKAAALAVKEVSPDETEVGHEESGDDRNDSGTRQSG